MAKPGQVIENPATGERVEFRKTANVTDGELLEFDYFVAPGARPPAARRHLHPKQEERFEVVSGSASFLIGAETRSGREGTTVTIPAGVAHRVVNVGDDHLHVITQYRPALRTEHLFETIFVMGRAGKLTRKGIPINPISGGVLASKFMDEVVVVPAIGYRGFAALFGTLGKLVGLTLPVSEQEEQ